MHKFLTEIPLMYTFKYSTKIDEYGRTELIYVIESDNKNFVKLFIERGLDISIADNEGKSPLMYAVEKGNEEIVYFLIGNSAEINIKDENGRTPLMYAITSGNERVVELLIMNGAGVNKEEKEVSNKNIVDFIEKNFKENINGLNRIILALKERKKEIDKLGESLKS